IGPNEQIASWKVAERKLTPREGERYVSFPADDLTNVGNMLRKGDRVDVWVEFDQPKRLGGTWKGAMKVIEGLEVASVRTAEGAEVMNGGLGAVAVAGPMAGLQQDGAMRGSASGKPSMNTFIMNERLYEAYALAALTGTVKLALPDVSLQAGADARVTADFEAFRNDLVEGEGT
ncbi:RcpC/CpaB family pilus assembly protein, partial [Cutibacterium acnes]